MIDFYSLYSIIKLIRTISPKIVHTFDTKPGLIGRLAARICSVPIIIGTLPGLGVLYSSEKKLIRMFRLFYQFVIKIVCELSTSTVFQNPDDRKLFLEKGIIKDSNSQIILGSGIDTNYFSMEKLKSSNLRKIRKSIGCENDDIVVTMVTRIIRSKGIQEFSNVAKRMNNNKVKFLLVGEYDPDDKNTFTKGEFENICDNIIWLGFRSDIREIMALSDIIALPTFYREGIPRVLLEGASLNKPLISTDAPGCREIIENGKNGYLIMPRDEEELKISIERLVSSPTERKRMGDLSRKLAVNNFDISRVVDAHKKLYNNLIKLNNFRI